ncbi:MAG: hypothetical protein BGO29_05210 [Bacteroidales bacterium 36-12]|jgi:hypothetical protein|nr:MAG: hypothetical protein BGO29_05210 [Bacteroidales bacterium 36-12]
MNTKLTLTIEHSVIEKAKRYAKRKERSLSDLIESYLKALTSENEMNKTKESPIVQSLRGSFSMPRNFDYKEELAKNLSEKYLSK